MQVDKSPEILDDLLHHPKKSLATPLGAKGVGFVGTPDFVEDDFQRQLKDYQGSITKGIGAGVIKFFTSLGGKKVEEPVNTGPSYREVMFRKAFKMALTRQQKKHKFAQKVKLQLGRIEDDVL